MPYKAFVESRHMKYYSELVPVSPTYINAQRLKIILNAIKYKSTNS